MRKIGKPQLLEIKALGHQEAEVERLTKEEDVERRFSMHKRAMAFLLSKYADCPDELKRYFGAE